MNKEKEYILPTVEVILFNSVDIIKTSNPISGEDGNDIFDDR